MGSYPQRGIHYKLLKADKEAGLEYDHVTYLTKVDVIEALTGLDFLTELPGDTEDQVEAETATELWPTEP